MTDEDLLPLKAGGDAPPELVRSLYELGREGVDAARLERLAQELAGSLAGIRSAESAGQSRAKPKKKKKMLIAVAACVAALAWLGYHAGGCSQSTRARLALERAGAASQSRQSK